MTHTMKNTTLTGAEKVLWQASYKFHLQNGHNEIEATKLADLKIVSKRKLGKSLNFKF